MMPWAAQSSSTAGLLGKTARTDLTLTLSLRPAQLTHGRGQIPMMPQLQLTAAGWWAGRQKAAAKWNWSLAKVFRNQMYHKWHDLSCCLHQKQKQKCCCGCQSAAASDLECCTTAALCHVRAGWVELCYSKSCWLTRHSNKTTDGTCNNCMSHFNLQGQWAGRLAWKGVQSIHSYEQLWLKPVRVVQMSTMSLRGTVALFRTLKISLSASQTGVIPPCLQNTTSTLDRGETHSGLRPEKQTLKDPQRVLLSPVKTWAKTNELINVKPRNCSKLCCYGLCQLVFLLIFGFINIRCLLSSFLLVAFCKL